MTILAGDIKLVASQVMNDVSEGGGAPTSTVIADGASNAIFPDISELDRAGGRVNLRKVFVNVQTTNTDSYFGANVIVADPPDDPNVSVTLFTTNDVFDTRDSAKSRVESYLALGPVSSAYLYGNHIAGQRTITLIQRSELPLPIVGTTLVVRKLEGTASQAEQYVRVTSVAALERTFTDQQGDFKRMQVTLGISDALRVDFPGFDAYRLDSAYIYTGKSKVYETVVADAATYFGVVPLASSATLGDFSVQGSGIFTQLVPSAQIETPIADARMNQQTAAFAPGNAGVLSSSITATFTTTSSMFIGGSITPGSLQVASGGVTLVDSGGKLVNQADTSQVGTVDYENGQLSLTTNIFGTSGQTFTVQYTAAARPTVVSESIGIDVTQASQRLTYVLTLNPIPARGSLQVSYAVGGRWYVISDDGSGAIRGSDSSFGVGTINFSTGTVSLTLGALPDVSSKVILQWAPIAAAPIANPSLLTAPGSAVYIEHVAPNSIVPGSLTLTYNDGTDRTLTDNGSRGFTGYGTGLIDYQYGTIRFTPTTLPPVGTVVTVTATSAVKHQEAVGTLTDGGTTWTGSLTGPVKEFSVEMTVHFAYLMRIGLDNDATQEALFKVTDDGAGNLRVNQGNGGYLNIGSITYSTGAFTLNKTVSGFVNQQNVWTKVTPTAGGPSYIRLTGTEMRTVTLNTYNGPNINAFGQPEAVKATFAGANDSSINETFTVSDVRVTVSLTPNYTLAPSLRFTLGGYRYGWLYAAGGSGTTLYRAASGSSSAFDLNTPVGTVTPSSGVLLITTWAAGQPPTITNWAGVQDPPSSTTTSPLQVDAAIFRTAVAPVRNGSFSVAGTWADGTTFTATADSNGVISSGGDQIGTTPGAAGVFGKIDYATGIVEIRFARKVSSPTANVVLGSYSGAASGNGAFNDLSYLGVSGVSNVISKGVLADSLRYNASAYTYLPLDADILGIDPVRLPTDGRVPIFRPGGFAVVGHTKSTTATVSNGQTIDCARVRLSRVRVIGNDGVVINTGYTADLEAGTVTFSDVTGYSQPVTVEDRIEDMMLIRDAQINGQLTFTRALTHDYPSGSYVSSALVAGDLVARVSTVFDQMTWTNTWSDAIIGNAATATFNSVLAPIEVTNKGAVTERWAVQFTSSTAFQIIGEHVGVIATGSTGADCSPVNPATGQPYFTIPALGWGAGWSTGNVLRFNTVGALFPVWVVRTIQQGPATVNQDSFTLLARGDVDAP